MLIDFYYIFEQIGPQLSQLAWTHKIGLLKLAKSAFLIKLIKLQYKNRLTAAHAVSFTDSTIITFQNEELIIIKASALLSSAILILF